MAISHSGNSLYEPVRYVGQVTIDSTNKDLVFTEGGTQATATLQEGTYYLIRETGLTNNGTTVSAFWEAVIDALDVASPGGLSYDVQPNTASGTTFTNGTLEITNSGSANLQFLFSNANTTLPARWFGSPLIGGDLPLSGSDHPIQLGSIAGCWHSPHNPDDLRIDLEGDVIDSGGRAGTGARYLNPWTTTDEFRRNYYRFVHSTHVYRKRAYDSDLASDGDVQQFNDLNAFAQFWKEMRGKDLIAIYTDLEAASSSVLYPSRADKWAFVQMAEPNAPLSQVVRPMENTGGEYYEIDFRTVVVEDKSDNTLAYAF